MTFRQGLKRFRYHYCQFVEKQGFPIIMTVCAAVIILSAVWSGRFDHTLPTPTPPVDQAQSAARLQQQSLQDASTPEPSPTPEKSAWIKPLKSMIVLQPFQQSRMKPASISGVWQVHDALDLQAEYGEAISSIGDGVVQSVVEEGMLGICVIIDHADGFTSTYANLSGIAGLQPGDPVEAGQIIGFAGSSILDESHLGPHLHFQMTRDGLAVDPALFLDE